MKWKKTVCFTLIVGFTLFSCKKKEEDISQKKQETLEIFSEFQKNLKNELLTSIKNSGTAGAIDKCKTVSPEMETKFSNEKFTLTRISDKPRNPDHQAEGWELSVLKSWKEDVAQGKKPEVVVKTNKNEVKILKPIMIGNALCLQCHGKTEEIEIETLQVIQEKYPNDQATGYEMNELRGAFLGIMKNKE